MFISIFIIIIIVFTGPHAIQYSDNLLIHYGTQLVICAIYLPVRIILELQRIILELQRIILELQRIILELQLI
jgi:hypothetical protein